MAEVEELRRPGLRGLDPAEELVGGNYIFDLDASGTVKQSSGTGWSAIDTGVNTLVATNLGGTDYIFDLNSAGTAKASHGLGWYTIDTASAADNQSLKPEFGPFS